MIQSMGAHVARSLGRLALLVVSLTMCIGLAITDASGEAAKDTQTESDSAPKVVAAAKKQAAPKVTVNGDELRPGAGVVLEQGPNGTVVAKPKKDQDDGGPTTALKCYCKSGEGFCVDATSQDLAKCVSGTGNACSQCRWKTVKSGGEPDGDGAMQ
jgi:hypothetical protein